MRSLTIRQPWAGLILDGHAYDGIKDVENRSWNTTYRGPLLIHAAATWDPFCSDYRDGLRTWFLNRPSSTLGAFVGVVDLVAVSDDTAQRSPWAVDGFHHWRLANPRPFAKPVAWKGRLGLWFTNVHDVTGLPEQLVKCGLWAPHTFTPTDPKDDQWVTPCIRCSRRLGASLHL